MKIKVGLLDNGNFFNVKSGTEYSKKAMQSLIDFGVEVIFNYDYLDNI